MTGLCGQLLVKRCWEFSSYCTEGNYRQLYIKVKVSQLYTDSSVYVRCYYNNKMCHIVKQLFCSISLQTFSYITFFLHRVNNKDKLHCHDVCDVQF